MFLEIPQNFNYKAIQSNTQWLNFDKIDKYFTIST